MPLLIAALLLAALAIGIAPAARSADDVDPTPWPPAVARVAGLGRPFATADVAWLKTVQLLGSDGIAAQGYPHLEKWIDLITGLDPSFEEPYFFGATLLVTDPARAPAIDRLLERGEQAFPEVFNFPMLRGFLAQFGLLDTARAAGHYERASTMKGAPPYLKSYAARLAREQGGCGSILANLKELSSSTSSAQAQALADQRGAILEHCFTGLINNTATQLRFNKTIKGSHATLAEVEQALGGPVPHPPGRCWELAFDRAKLVPCPAASEGPTPQEPTP